MMFSDGGISSWDFMMLCDLGTSKCFVMVGFYVL